jgi:tetratricopeptide (TPR) repeat protein
MPGAGHGRVLNGSRQAVDRIWFGILGPLLVGDGNSLIGVPAAKQRVLLAALVVRAGTVVSEPSAARAWLDSQRVNLVTVAAHTAEHGWCRHTTQLAAILSRYLDAGGHYPEAVTIHGHARRAARRSGDHSAEAAALTSLGLANFRQGRYRPAASHLQQALGLHRQTGDRVGQARVLGHLGLVDLRQDRYQQATAYYMEALALFREFGDRSGEADTLNGMGAIFLATGRPDAARINYHTALSVADQLGDQDQQARAHDGTYPAPEPETAAVDAVSRPGPARS